MSRRPKTALQSLQNRVRKLESERVVAIRRLNRITALWNKLWPECEKKKLASIGLRLSSDAQLAVAEFFDRDSGVKTLCLVEMISMPYAEDDETRVRVAPVDGSNWPTHLVVFQALFRAYGVSVSKVQGITQLATDMLSVPASNEGGV